MLPWCARSRGKWHTIARSCGERCELAARRWQQMACRGRRAYPGNQWSKIDLTQASGESDLLSRSLECADKMLTVDITCRKFSLGGA